MPHTQSRYQQDLGFTDGKMRATPQQELIAFGTTVLTRTAAANINFAQAISQTVNYDVNVTTMIMRRLGFSEDLQEQFGGTGIPASAQTRAYRPDQIGAMNTAQQLQPRTAFKTKGFRLISYDVIYQINTANLTAFTTRVDMTTYPAAAAPVITSLLTSGVNGLSTTFGANIITTTVTLPVQGYFVTNDSDLWIELTAQTGGSGTLTLWGIDVAVEFNYN